MTQDRLIQRCWKTITRQAMNDFVVVQWPESQELMDKPGFEENCFLINDDNGLNKFGSSAYFVNKQWLEQSEQTSADNSGL